MRTEKVILRRVQDWQNNPHVATGLYRLLTYLKWGNVPEQYKPFFNKDIIEVWDDDLKDFKEEHILLDIDAEIKAAFRGLFKKNITQVLSIIPIILADIFVYGKQTDRAQAKLHKVTQNYLDNVSVDVDLAEAGAIFEIVELLEYLQNLVKIDLGFNPQEMLSKIIEEAGLAKIKEDSQRQFRIDNMIDQALAEYEQHKKEEENAEEKTDI